MEGLDFKTTLNNLQVVASQVSSSSSKLMNSWLKSSGSSRLVFTDNPTRFQDRVIVEFGGSNKKKDARKSKTDGPDGFLLLSLPDEKFPVELLIQPMLLDTLKRFLEDWILSQKLCSEVHSSFLQIYPMVKHAIYIGAPVLLVSSEKFKIFLKFATCHWIMNDFITRSITCGQVPFLPKSFFADLSKIMRNIIAGEYQSVDAVPYFELTLFHECLKTLFHVAEEMRENVGPDAYERSYGPLLHELLDWCESLKIITHCQYPSSTSFSKSLVSSSRKSVVHEKKYNFRESELNLLELLRYLSGRGILLQLMSLLTDSVPDVAVRDTRLFKMYYEKGMLAHTLSMDITDFYSPSLQYNFNLLLIQFKSLERNLLEDIPKKSGKAKKLEKFVKNFCCFIDGEIKYHL